MKEGIDALVLEGTESTGDCGVTEGWFQQAIAGMFYILSPLYVSKEILVDFAKLQGADVYFTRESDALPNTLDISYHPPEYSRTSKEHLKEISFRYSRCSPLS